MRLNATLVIVIIRTSEDIAMFPTLRCFLLPTKGEVSCRDDFDEVHKVERLFICLLMGVIEGIDMVVCPAAGARGLVAFLHILDHDVAQAGAESQVMDPMREGVGGVLVGILEFSDRNDGRHGSGALAHIL